MFLQGTPHRMLLYFVILLKQFQDIIDESKLANHMRIVLKNEMQDSVSIVKNNLYVSN
jgi:hypothetical protein